MIKVRVDRGDIWLEVDGDLLDIVEDTAKAIHAIYATLQSADSRENAEIYRQKVTGMLSDPQSVTWDTDEDTTDTWLVNMAELKRQMEEGQ